MFEFIHNLQHDQNTFLCTMIFGSLFIGFIYCVVHIYVDVRREGRLEKQIENLVKEQVSRELVDKKLAEKNLLDLL